MSRSIRKKNKLRSDFHQFQKYEYSIFLSFESVNIDDVLVLEIYKYEK